MLSLRHKYYVSKVVLDDNQNIWTAGGDGLVYFFKTERLLSCIENNKQNKSNKVKNIYKPTKSL